MHSRKATAQNDPYSGLNGGCVIQHCMSLRTSIETICNPKESASGEGKHACLSVFGAALLGDAKDLDRDIVDNMAASDAWGLDHGSCLPSSPPTLKVEIPFFRVFGSLEVPTSPLGTICAFCGCCVRAGLVHRFSPAPVFARCHPQAKRPVPFQSTFLIPSKEGLLPTRWTNYMEPSNGDQPPHITPSNDG